MSHPSTLHVDLDAVAHNHGVVTSALREAARHPGGPPRPAGLCAVLKADGYGLGATRLAKKLAHLGLDLIAVYHPDEARELLNTNLGVPVLIFMPVHGLGRDDRLFHALSRGLIHLSIHDRSCFDAAADIADSLGIAIPVHVAVDTGMARAGSLPNDAAELIDRTLDHPRLRLAGVATHFASADSSAALTGEQLETFSALLGRYGVGPTAPRPRGARGGGRSLPTGVRIHAANSFAMFRSPAAHFTTARVGLALLGYASEEFADAGNFAFGSAASALRPVLRWSTTIVQLKEIAPGEPVGYGSTWRAPADRSVRIGTLPVGYADGYPIALSSDAASGEPRAHVTLTTASGEAASAPVVGRVSMDQVTIDVSHLPEGAVHRGHTVDVVSPDQSAPNHLPRLASAAGAITHELLCRLSSRLDRRYVSDPAGQAAAASSASAEGLLHSAGRRESAETHQAGVSGRSARPASPR